MHLGIRIMCQQFLFFRLPNPLGLCYGILEALGAWNQWLHLPSSSHDLRLTNLIPVILEESNIQQSHLAGFCLLVCPSAPENAFFLMRTVGTKYSAAAMCGLGASNVKCLGAVQAAAHLDGPS